MYKLIAIDMDGTLLNERKEVTAEVKDAIQKAKEKGVKIVLATGRPMGGVRRYIKELNLMDEDEFVVTYNGALVQNTHTKEIVSESSLSYKDLVDLYGLSLKIQSPVHFFDSENVYTPNTNISRYTVLESFLNEIPLLYRTIDKVSPDIRIPKIMFIDEPERLDKAIEKIPEYYYEKYYILRSAPHFLEIHRPGVRKGEAVKQLVEKLMIKREEVICIGDGDNDVSMIEYAGVGVAMGNATAAVKRAAQFQTLSNEEDGVAYAIKKLILND